MIFDIDIQDLIISISISSLMALEHSCTVYNAAPPENPKSSAVDQKWGTGLERGLSNAHVRISLSQEEDILEVSFAFEVSAPVKMSLF